MVGFAMMQGAVPFILFAGIIGLPGVLFWFVASLVLLRLTAPQVEDNCSHEGIERVGEVRA